MKFENHLNFNYQRDIPRCGRIPFKPRFGLFQAN